MTTTSRRKGVKPASVSKMLDVLRLIADGYTDARIGRALNISEDTVKTRTRALYEDLGASNRAHAVAIAYQRGLLGIGVHDSSCALRRPHACDCKEVSR